MHMQNVAAADAPRILYDATPSSFFQPADISPSIVDLAIALAKEIEPMGRRAKFYAFEALTFLCPQLDAKALAKRLSFYTPASPHEQIRRAERASWWQGAGADHVMGGLIVSIRGAEAE